MLPSPRPETTAETRSRGGPRGQARLLDGHDLLALVLHHDVVVLVQGVVVGGSERLRVVLDESAVGREVLERLADLVCVVARVRKEGYRKDNHSLSDVKHQLEQEKFL